MTAGDQPNPGLPFEVGTTQSSSVDVVAGRATMQHRRSPWVELVASPSANLEDEYDHGAADALTIDLSPFGFPPPGTEALGDAQRRDVVSLDIQHNGPERFKPAC